MDQYPFIFSDARGYRVRRHLLFWGCWWLTQAVLYSFTPSFYQVSWLQRFEVSSVDALAFMLPHIFLSYSLMYFVIPRFVVKGKYVQTTLLVALLFVVTAAMSGAISLYALSHIRHYSRVEQPGKTYVGGSFFMSLMAGLRGGITIGGVAAAIKLMKYWYVKQARNLELQKENIASQLQLLKAQVHPHFLFNTLNNVY